MRETLIQTKKGESSSIHFTLCPSVINFFCCLISLALYCLLLCFMLGSSTALFGTIGFVHKPIGCPDIRYDRWVRAVKAWYCPSLHCKVCLLAGKNPTKGHNDETHFPQIHSTWVLKGSLFLFISHNKRRTKYFMYSIHKTRARGFSAPLLVQSVIAHCKKFNYTQSM